MTNANGGDLSRKQLKVAAILIPTFLIIYFGIWFLVGCGGK